MSEWLKKQRVMRRYDMAATIYDMRYAEEQAAKIEAALKHVKLEKTNVVLDVGCGTGVLFDYVATKTEATVGIDFSKKTLLEARKRTLNKNLDSIHLVHADADYLPFHNNIFDLVFAMTILQNSPNPRTTLTEMSRVARNDTSFAITGLKKIFTKRSFQQLLDDARLKVVAEENNELKCYVAICTRQVVSSLLRT